MIVVLFGWTKNDLVFDNKTFQNLTSKRGVASNWKHVYIFLFFSPFMFNWSSVEVHLQANPVLCPPGLYARRNFASKIKTASAVGTSCMKTVEKPTSTKAARPTKKRRPKLSVDSNVSTERAVFNHLCFQGISLVKNKHVTYYRERMPQHQRKTTKQVIKLQKF